jgi:membrane protease YdiL (CAAX protease family)
MNTPPSALVGVSTNLQNEVNASEKRQRWFEVSLVLLVAFGGPILYSLHLLKAGPRAASEISSARWATGLVQEVSALLLLGYVLSRRGRKFANLGLCWSLRDVGMGFALVVASYLAYGLGYTLVQGIHQLAYGFPATGPTGRDFFGHPPLIAIPFSLLNPFFEELIVRAYLMTEVIQLTGSSTLAVVLSVGVQFSYHLYYGWAGAISMSFPFVVLALYYARSRFALPIIVAHGFFDVYALLRLL